MSNKVEYVKYSFEDYSVLYADGKKIAEGDDYYIAAAYKKALGVEDFYTGKDAAEVLEGYSPPENLEDFKTLLEDPDTYWANFYDSNE